ncbi:MAG: hypothetical protein H0V43_04545 [Gemmatimonadales bacterium]|nr:hypothetical protein [Gemmatimonadales bacterium]MBA3553165.1 hypothetical protein [Gemmatimonadales bacterium]
MPRKVSLLPLAIAGFLAGVLLALAFGRVIGAGDPAIGHSSLPDTALARRAIVLVRDDLPDAAIAVFDSVRPRIYLNTRLLAWVGPDLAAFLRAHEEGHIAYHHVSERRFGLVRVETPLPVLHGYEFAADCYAGRALRAERPVAVRAALRFFQQRRTLVTDAEHPSMGARADSLIACLTDPGRMGA